jgi:hypothetical protein
MPKRTLSAVVLVSLCVLTCSAQAPSSIAGNAFGGHVTSGSGPFSSSGYFIFLPANSGSSFRLIGADGIEGYSGTYSYSPTGALAYLTIIARGETNLVTLDFLASDSGTFYQALGTNSQAGTFQMVSGPAPSSMAGANLYLTVRTGAPPFSATGFGIFKAAPTSSTYVLDGAIEATNQHSSGTYSYTLLNRSAGSLGINDSAVGASTIYLVPTNATSGRYLISQASSAGFQIGAFTTLNTAVVITSPTNVPFYSTPLATVDLAGTATDTLGVVRVTWTNSAGFAGTANGTNVWNAPGVPLNPGTNRITVTALDAVGNTAQATLWVNKVPPTRIPQYRGDLAFGSVPAGSSLQHTLTIGNLGNSSLTIFGLTYPAGFSGNFIGTIPPGASQQVPVVFAPTNQSTYGGVMTATSNATSGTNTIPISGTGYCPLTNHWSLWWQNSNGLLAIWAMQGDTRATSSHLYPSAPGWAALVTPDLNPAGQATLFFENTAGRLAAWLMNGTNRQSSAYLTPLQVDPSWQLRATGDLTGNGQRDLFWQRSDGYLAAWLMNGLVATQAFRLQPGSVDPSWSLVGTGDFNRDNHTDIIWQNTNGGLAVWFMNGTNHLGSAYLNPPKVDPSWKVVGALDFNHDGHTGLLWRQDSGALAYWEMDGTNLVHAGRFTPSLVDTAWAVVGPR